MTDLHFPASLSEGKSEDCGPGTHTVSSGCSCAARGQCARLELQCVFFLQSAPGAQTWEICRHRDELGLWRVMRYKQRIRAHSSRALSSLSRHKSRPRFSEQLPCTCPGSKYYTTTSLDYLWRYFISACPNCAALRILFSSSPICSCAAVKNSGQHPF